MKMYRINEAELLLPEQAQDQTLNMLAYTMPDPLTGNAPPLQEGVLPEFSLVINRREIDAEITTLQFADQHMRILEQTLQNFTLLQRMDTFVDGVTAVTAEFTWQSDQGVMHQWLAYMICPVPLMQETRTALVLTGSSREGVHVRYAHVFDQTLYSLVFRRTL